MPYGTTIKCGVSKENSDSDIYISPRFRLEHAGPVEIFGGEYDFIKITPGEEEPGLYIEYPYDCKEEFCTWFGEECLFDRDGDNVPDEEDKCPDTVLPESIPTKRLLTNHYADIDGDGIFETIKRKIKGSNDYIIRDRIDDSNYTLEDTYGCSCEQILEIKPGSDKGEEKFGCVIGTIKTWIKQIGWAKKPKR